MDSCREELVRNINWELRAFVSPLLLLELDAVADISPGYLLLDLRNDRVGGGRGRV